MGTDVRIEGADVLRRSLDQAAAELGDFTDLNTAIGRLVTAKAATLAPRRSGRLSASLRAAARKDSATFTNPLPYAGPVHWGWPRRNIRANTFLVDAAALTEPTWVDWYATRVEQVIDNIEGDH